MKKSFVLMVIAAILYSICTPLSKYLFSELPSIFVSSLFYLGAGVGVGIIFLIARLTKKDKDELLSKKDFIYVGIINICDSISSFLLFYGISLISSEEASLLQSFEVVSTSLFAYFIFKEKISWRLIIAILFLLTGSMLLGFSFNSALEFNIGTFYVLLAVSLFGISNNVIKKVSNKSTLEFTTFKCLIPGIILLIISLATGQYNLNIAFMGYSLIGGFFSFGVSVFFYTLAVRKLSASLGTTIFSINPFFAAILSIIIFKDIPEWNFYVSLTLLVIGEAFAAYDNYINSKKEATLYIDNKQS